MRLKLKMGRGFKKYTAGELVALADKTLGEGYLYVSAPYGMAIGEFMMYYGKYYFILPSVPTKEDFEEGFFTPTGARMMRFWK